MNPSRTSRIYNVTTGAYTWCLGIAETPCCLIICATKGNVAPYGWRRDPAVCYAWISLLWVPYQFLCNEFLHFQNKTFIVLNQQDHSIFHHEGHYFTINSIHTCVFALWTVFPGVRCVAPTLHHGCSIVLSTMRKVHLFVDSAWHPVGLISPWQLSLG